MAVRGGMPVGRSRSVLPIPSSGASLEQVAGAKEICARCLVRSECLSFALRTRQAHGVWGGMSEQERIRCGELMNGEWIEPQARATRVACMRTTARQLKALHGSVQQGAAVS